MKKFLRIFLFFIFSFLIFIIYLSTIGIETKRLNNQISNKIQEFEIILDTAEALEEHLEEQEQQDEGYSTEWNPYEDEDYNSEGYEDGENYDDNY